LECGGLTPLWGGLGAGSNTPWRNRRAQSASHISSACRVNPDIRKELAFSVRPLDAGDGEGELLRAIVMSIANMGPIADGALLYTCDVLVHAATPPGRYPLYALALAASDAAGRSILTQGRSGVVQVVSGGGSRPPAILRRPQSGSGGQPRGPGDPAAAVRTARPARPATTSPPPEIGKYRRSTTSRPTPTATPAP
jgi:hypothetical protein